TAQSALFVLVMPLPAAIVRLADDGHSVDPPTVVVVVPPMLVVVVPPSDVVVVPPMLVVVVVPASVVDVVVDDVVEVVTVVEVVVDTGQGQFRFMLCPTAFFRQ